MIFDAHTHMNGEDFDLDRKDAILRAQKAGVGAMAFVGYDEKSIRLTDDLLDTYPGLVGVYACEAENAIDYDENFESLLKKEIQKPKVVAIGEVGLDYYWKKSSKAIQMEVLLRQIAIAKEAKVPLAFHIREAVDDVLEVLKTEKIDEPIIHNFGYDWETAKKFLDFGAYLSFSGVTTFKKSKEVRQAAQKVPKDRYLVETDSPYLTPEPKRGQRNESQNIRYTVNRIADVRETSYETVAEETFANTVKAYHLKWDFRKGWVKETQG